MRDTLTVKPLLISVDPQPGEYLMSLVVRAAEANVFRRPGALLSLVGMEAANVEMIPFTGQTYMSGLSALLGVDEQQVRGRMHLPVGANRAHEQVDWFGTRMPRRFIEATYCRVGWAEPVEGGFHPAIWQLRPLSFCPETFHQLISQCPKCHAALRWRTVGSLGRCSKCEEVICAPEGAQLRDELRAEYQAIAALADSNSEVRAAAVAALPYPFSSWEPGDCFHAVVDMGLIASEPKCPRGCMKGKTQAQGNFDSYTIDHLIAGYRFVMGWPGSLKRLVSEVSGGQTGKSRRVLGRLAKFLDNTAPVTPLGILMQENIPKLIVDECSIETISGREAKKYYGIEPDVLRRLDQDGRCLVSKKRGLPTAYNKRSLSQSIFIWRAAATAGAVTKQVGLPICFVGWAADQGLYERVADSDAQLLAGHRDIFDPASVQGLAERIKARVGRDVAHSKLVPLHRCMRGELHPGPWLDVIGRIVDGTLVAARSIAGKDVLDVLVPGDELAAIRESWISRPLPDLAASLLAGSRLIGIDNTVLGAALAKGLIHGEMCPQGAKVKLAELRRFRTTYGLAADASKLTGVPAHLIGSLLRDAGIEPVAQLRNFYVWLQADIRAFAESHVVKKLGYGVGQYETRVKTAA